MAERPVPGASAEKKGSVPGSRRAKLSWKEARELEALPGELEALEREQKPLAGRLSDPALYQDRDADPRALHARHQEIEAELTRLLTRWEELEGRR